MIGHDEHEKNITRKKTKRYAAATRSRRDHATNCSSNLTDECLHSYFESLNGHKPGDLYQLVMGEVEKPLFRAVLDLHQRQPKRSRRDPRHQSRHARKKLKDVQAPGPMSPSRKTRDRAPIDARQSRGTERRRGLRALLSVADKHGLVPFANGLVEPRSRSSRPAAPQKRCAPRAFPSSRSRRSPASPRSWTAASRRCTRTSTAACSARRGVDEAVLVEHGIDMIDVLVVNLYPFEATTARPDCTDAEAIENIDIGGPAMLRAAAKNHERITVVVDPADYSTVLAALNEAEVPPSLRRASRDQGVRPHGALRHGDQQLPAHAQRIPRAVARSAARELAARTAAALRREPASAGRAVPHAAAARRLGRARDCRFKARSCRSTTSSTRTRRFKPSTRSRARRA